MKFNYDTLSEREQKMVKFGAIALAAILLFGVLMPLDSSVAKARTRINKKQQDLVWMKSVAPFLAAQAGSAHQNNGESLIVIVDRSARESGLGKSLAGTDPSGAGGIQVRLEKAPFDAIIGWLSRLSQQNGIGVEGATIDGAGAPGVVNAAIVLKQQ
ncbi:type II secretion system M [Olea europaea subsp. europaea]|jgi:general secretion pathway protein M|uniref:Type II secretion system M n=1 Tax=Olea europaea subsp. europaea TaxID=158383 RepID=A0A8S0RD64_OLEEU|nr:type II secretion system M [Olea europaea subsp. europaea]